MSQRQSEICYCSRCGAETNHIVVLVRKPSPFKNSSHRKLKEFIHGVLKGWFFGAFIASMDDLSRHLICEQCGDKIIDE
ncbi:hypothetical protein CSW98_10510 [Vibrio sp. HA2012]|uniref:hypothetical protein n=1 Tax=Vibrio sp. HA2012 TaxID=1971595 RepID=UPI000C2BADAB|nr:hypothetical protein [Vibrio sp. HA2012]PJC86022.1 hypothetical protein CSW98_10510 [Vibrio sp. HA2012]